MQYNIFSMDYKVRKIYHSFSRTYKRIPLHYDLCQNHLQCILMLHYFKHNDLDVYFLSFYLNSLFFTILNSEVSLRYSLNVKNDS